MKQILVTHCKECPHYRYKIKTEEGKTYNSGCIYYSQKYPEKLKSEGKIPKWCPLEDYKAG